nr:MAG TPA_asm: putative terminase small subunit [Caudoviricetes sp.]
MAKITIEIVNEIIDNIEQGLTKKAAAALCGITEQTFYNWLAIGRDQEPPEGLEDISVKDLRARAKKHKVRYVNKLNKKQLIAAITEAETLHLTLLERMTAAQARGQMEHIKNIKEQAKEDWRASAWFLERTDPENYGRRDRFKGELDHSGTIKTEHEEKTQIQIEQTLKHSPEMQRHLMSYWEMKRLAEQDE